MNSFKIFLVVLLAVFIPYLTYNFYKIITIFYREIIKKEADEK